MLLAFVVAPTASPAVPPREQWLAAGAALDNLLNAAHLLGYGARVLSGARCKEEALETELGVHPAETVASFVSIGQIGDVPPPARSTAIDAVWWRWPVPVSNEACGKCTVASFARADGDPALLRHRRRHG